MVGWGDGAGIGTDDGAGIGAADGSGIGTADGTGKGCGVGAGIGAADGSQPFGPGFASQQSCPVAAKQGDQLGESVGQSEIMLLCR